jgi:hypothetical protein
MAPSSTASLIQSTNLPTKRVTASEWQSINQSHYLPLSNCASPSLYSSTLHSSNTHRISPYQNTRVRQQTQTPTPNPRPKPRPTPIRLLPPLPRPTDLHSTFPLQKRCEPIIRLYPIVCELGPPGYISIYFCCSWAGWVWSDLAWVAGYESTWGGFRSCGLCVFFGVYGWSYTHAERGWGSAWDWAGNRVATGNL